MVADSDNKIIKDSSLVLFDGVCHFCNNSVNFIIDHDPKNKFVFAPLQSEMATNILKQLGEKNILIDSIILVQNNRIYKRSRASLEIAKRLNGLWPLCYVFIVVPGFIRDFVYNIIANNRYKWFGKMEACRFPTAEERERFL
ncbi:thiol-disulfide oxidoreductase DCC family protein [uncultured Cytophaga sp.]|uniref:thiol-disulfide oxidoreductase DCC family protein n=1 Tax=uncultured Cytophaga sp. TaxID=160238 RepID=UPI00261E9AF9|nr:thiol-disulfide oxidoreductase DCC family protein [uncultured Cytophaga sp.]